MFPWQINQAWLGSLLIPDVTLRWWIEAFWTRKPSSFLFSLAVQSRQNFRKRQRFQILARYISTAQWHFWPPWTDWSWTFLGNRWGGKGKFATALISANEPNIRFRHNKANTGKHLWGVWTLRLFKYLSQAITGLVEWPLFVHLCLTQITLLRLSILLSFLEYASIVYMYM